MTPRLPKPLETRPADGGRLLSGLSADSAGIQNYVTKRDFRRSLQVEMRAEGYENLVLNHSLDAARQSNPSPTGGVVVIAQVRRDDGSKTIIAGTKTTLWACTVTSDMRYALNNEGVADYFAQDYVDETQHYWKKIADNLVPSERMWEVVSAGDYIVLNNGEELPMTYHFGDERALPIYELREQQIAKVGTICVHDDNLCVMDLTQLDDNAFESLMAPIESAVAASQDESGVISKKVSQLFPGGELAVGSNLFWENGAWAKVAKISADGTITTANGQPVASGKIYTENPKQYAAYTSKTGTQRYPWRFLPSMAGQPRRFGSIVPVSAEFKSKLVKFKYPVRSLSEMVTIGIARPSVTILYANIGGGTLTTEINLIGESAAMSCVIADKVQTPIYIDGDVPSSLQSSDAASGYAGAYVDLIGTGGQIVKALQQRDKVIVYKDTAEIFIGKYTGDIENPYQFISVALPTESSIIRYRNTVIAVDGTVHIYAGKNCFYKFDAISQTPQMMLEFMEAQSVFFDNAARDTENAFAVENPLTFEWNFFWKNNGGKDRALCYDYVQRTFRTTSAPINCAAKVQHPKRGDWMFVFADDSGAIQRYGLREAGTTSSNGIKAKLNGSTVDTDVDFFTEDDIGKSIWFAGGQLVAIKKLVSARRVEVYGSGKATAEFKLLPGMWHRNGQPYASEIETGVGDMGSADSEKMLSMHVVLTSSKSPNCKLDVAYKSGVTQLGCEFSQYATVENPEAHSVVQPTIIGYYLGGRITVTGANNPFEISKQIWHMQLLGTRSAARL